MDLDQGIITESEKRQKKKLLIDYLYANLKNHNFWAYRYFFCEFLGILNVVGAYMNIYGYTYDTSAGSCFSILTSRSDVPDGSLFRRHISHFWN